MFNLINRTKVSIIITRRNFTYSVQRDCALYHLLLKWRKLTALGLKKPASSICTKSSLSYIVKEQPKTASTLGNMKLFNPFFMENCAVNLITLLSRFKQWEQSAAPLSSDEAALDADMNRLLTDDVLRTNYSYSKGKAVSPSKVVYKVPLTASDPAVHTLRSLLERHALAPGVDAAGGLGLAESGYVIPRSQLPPAHQEVAVSVLRSILGSGTGGGTGSGSGSPSRRVFITNNSNSYSAAAASREKLTGIPGLVYVFAYMIM